VNLKIKKFLALHSLIFLSLAFTAGLLFLSSLMIERDSFPFLSPLPSGDSLADEYNEMVNTLPQHESFYAFEEERAGKLPRLTTSMPMDWIHIERLRHDLGDPGGTPEPTKVYNIGYHLLCTPFFDSYDSNREREDLYSGALEFYKSRNNQKALEILGRFDNYCFKIKSRENLVQILKGLATLCLLLDPACLALYFLISISFILLGCFFKFIVWAMKTVTDHEKPS